MTAETLTAHDVCMLAPVIPVITVARVSDAEPLAKALVAGGLPALEVTFRTDAALDALSIMAKVPGAVPGAGTLRTPGDVAAAVAAGARFGVSPGATPALLDAVDAAGLPFLPGAASASEAMALAERGYAVQKFFPAGAAGGPSFLKSLASPLPDILFCPTGGVSLANAPDYLALPNVIVVGGSWVVPGNLIDAGDWAGIERLAAEAVATLASATTA